MSKRIGQVLVERGLIDEVQLRHALQTQRISGSHLGTALIDLGYLDAECLGEELSRFLNAGHASLETLIDLPYSLVHLVPQDLVQRHRTIPIKQDGEILHLAVIDPKNLAALDEISKVTGFHVVPWVAPEARILQAMEKHYGIPQKRRFLELAAPAEGLAPRPASRPPKVVDRRPAVPDEPRPDAPKRAAPEGPRPISVSPIAPVADALSRAETAEEAARIVVDYGAQSLAACVVFEVEADWARIVAAQGIDDHVKPAPGRTFSAGGGFFLLQSEDRPCYRGPVPQDSATVEFLGTLREMMPAEILVVPVDAHEDLRMLLYGDGGAEGRIEEPTALYLRLAQKLALALRMIRLKEEIRSV